MKRAYIEPYLRGVMRNLGVMSHFCINEHGLSPEEYSKLFANSHVAEQISIGNPRFLAGLSGIEMAEMLLESSGEYKCEPVSSELHTVSPEYWAGWVLAYCQWYSSKSFSAMYEEGLTYDRILSMYYPMHEADLTKIVEMLAL